MSVWVDQPAIVELMGHAVIAGVVNEEEHAGAKMLRVDVPEVDGRAPFTKFFGGSAVYAVTPTDQATMVAAAEKLTVRPVALYVLPDLQLTSGTSDHNEPEWEDYDLEDDGDEELEF